jgi:hypothetical protein
LIFEIEMADVYGRVPLIPCYLTGNSVNTIPRSFRGKMILRFQRKLQQFLDPTVGLGVGCGNQHVDVALWKDLSSSNLYGARCGIAQKEGAGFIRNPGHVSLRLGLIGAKVIEPGQLERELLLHSE